VSLAAVTGHVAARNHHLRVSQTSSLM
jgi:hypothetical protein